MEDTNKYLILTENDGRYKVSANTWQEALVKYYKYSGSYVGITFSEFSKLIETKEPKESIELLNQLQMHDDDIESFICIDEEFLALNIHNIDEEIERNVTNK